MVTIKDVAERAGVNASTVSRALKDSAAISQKTKDKVKKAMDELGYVPNLAAKMLASGLTHSIGVIFPPLEMTERISQPFFMEILNVINNEARERAYTIAIATGTDVDELATQVQLMYREKRVDGFIVLYAMKDDPVQQYLMKNKIPFVVLGTPVAFENETTYIDNDNRLMGKTALQHLVENGHERILFVTDDLESQVFSARYVGYQQGAQQLDIDLHEAVLFDRRAPDVLDAFIAKISSEHITALIVIDDMVSLRVSQFLSFYQLKVPHDISIISFNNSVYTNIIHPYLTTFDINIARLGKASFSRIYEKVQTKTDENDKVIVPFHLKKGESVRNLNKK